MNVVAVDKTGLEKSRIRYDQFKVLRVKTLDGNSLKQISRPDMSNLYDIWNVGRGPPIGQHADIMISPQNMDTVVNELKKRGMEYSTMIKDVQTLIDLENQGTKTLENRNTDHPMTWTEYHSQNDMEAYMEYLVETYPEMVSIEDIGESYEGRTMRVLKICKGGACGKKPTMWIDGGIHAREWISPAVATYHMRELVENGDKYPSEIVDQLDWYILPVHNPDGYEYSRVRDRFWRKSRYGC